MPKKVTKKRAKKLSIKTSATKVIKKPVFKRKPKKIPAIQKGYASITPYLIVEGCHQAIQFYKKAFGAKEVFRMDKPDRKITHAELKIGGSKIMIADACPEMKIYAPEKYKGSPVSIHLYIENVDGVVKRAVALGAILVQPPETMFYGDRMAVIIDPFGHTWDISTHVENVTPAQVKKRAAGLFKSKK